MEKLVVVLIREKALHKTFGSDFIILLNCHIMMLNT